LEESKFHQKNVAKFVRRHPPQRVEESMGRPAAQLMAIPDPGRGPRGFFILDGQSFLPVAQGAKLRKLLEGATFKFIESASLHGLSI
jgi:hypothetical protein